MQEKLSLISGQIHELLALLTVCTTSDQTTSTAVDELQRQAAQLQSTSQQAHAHLSCMRDTLKIMADKTAQAADVDWALRQLQGTMLEVGDQAAREVQRVCSEVHHSLSKDLDMVFFAVDQLRGSAEEIASELRSLEARLEALGQHVKAEAHLTREAVHDSTAAILAVRRGLSVGCVVVALKVGTRCV